MTEPVVDDSTGEVKSGPQPPQGALAVHAQQKARGWRFGASGMTYTLQFEVNPGHADQLPKEFRGGARLWWKPEGFDATLLSTAAIGGSYSIKDDADDFEHHILTIKLPQADVVEGVAVMDGPAKNSNGGVAGVLFIQNNQMNAGL